MWVVQCWSNDYGEEFISQEFEFETQEEAMEFKETEWKCHDRFWTKITIEEESL